MRALRLLCAALFLGLAHPVFAQAPAPAAPGLAQLREKAAQRAGPAVISLRVRRVIKPEPKQRFSRPRRVSVEQISGSGVILRSDGLLATNAHVVDSAVMIKAVLPDGRVVPAAPVLFDRASDLAILRLKDRDVYPFVELAARAPSPGDQVVAIGDAFGRGRRITAGVMVGWMDPEHEELPDDIVVSAEVLPGQSGGALLNLDGALIGVLVARVDRNGAETFGVAVPLTKLRPALESAQAGRVTVPASRQSP